METVMAGGDKTTAKSKKQEGPTMSNKHGKTGGDGTTPISKTLIDNTTITTEPNGKSFDIRPRMKIFGATEQEMELSRKAYTSAI